MDGETCALGESSASAPAPTKVPLGGRTGLPNSGEARLLREVATAWAASRPVWMRISS